MNKKRILVIDDEEDLCFLVKMNLESTGEFEVIMAFSGEEGVEKLKRENFDLVMTDFNMPGMNGEEVMDAAREINPSLPVLLFSVYHDDSATLPPRVKEKASGIICKPINHEELHKVINDTLVKKI